MISSTASTAGNKLRTTCQSCETSWKKTYGVILYQEQVMQIANRVAGFSLAEADVLRYAMGKKKREEITAQREKVLNECASHKVPAKKAEHIFDLMAKLAGYGLN